MGHPPTIDQRHRHRAAALDCESIGLELSMAATGLGDEAIAAICRQARALFRPEQGLIVHGVHGELLATDVQMRELTGVGWLPGTGPAPAGWVVVGPDGEAVSADALPRADVHRTGRAVLGRCLGLRAPGGGVRWVDASAHPVVDRRGVLVATITTVRDRDEWGGGDRRAAASAEAIAQPAAVAVCDADGTVVSFDEQAALRYPGIRLGGRLAAAVRWNLPVERVERLLACDAPAWSGTLWMPGPDGRLAPALLRLVRTVHRDGAFTVTIVEPQARAAVEDRTDEATGLGRRGRFLDVLARSIVARDHESGPVVVVAVGMADLSRATEVHGSGAVEQAVIAAAAALRRSAHGADHLARLTDASFAVCCHHLGAHADVVEYGERLRSSVAEALRVVDPPLSLAVHAGVATSEASADDPSALLGRAEVALARAQRGDQGQIRRFDATLRAELERQRAAEAVVRAAISSGRVRLGYQPIVSLAEETVVGAEALLRLLDDDGEPVPAGEAVAIAEERGLIRELGLLVLEESCREAARWQAALPERFLTIAVNLSARQLSDPDLVAQVQRVLEETGLDPARLKLEMTETILMEDSDLSAAQLARLKMLGVRLSADDFGTGYSSLAYLKRFPLDVIKADLSFVAGLPASPEDAAVISAIVGVAGALGLRVVAEGVEREEQRRALVELGCDHGQGWLWSRAVEDGGFLDRVAALDRAAHGCADGAAPSDGAGALPVEAEPGEAAASGTDTVLRVLAHEVRGPLSALAGWASLVAEDPTCATDAAAPMLRAVGRIDGIIDRLDDLQALDLGRLRLDATLLDLDALVRDVVEDLHDALAVPVRVEALHVGSAMVLADRLRIAQVVENLVRNAGRYSPPEGTVLVIVSRRARWVEVAVHDDGEGIAPDRIGQAFRKYGRPDPRSSGAGIGLYLARGIARSHGGDVTYRRRAHRPGSVFTLRLAAESGPIRARGGGHLTR